MVKQRITLLKMEVHPLPISGQPHLGYPFFAEILVC